MKFKKRKSSHKLYLQWMGKGAEGILLTGAAVTSPVEVRTWRECVTPWNNSIILKTISHDSIVFA